MICPIYIITSNKLYHKNNINSIYPHKVAGSSPTGRGKGAMVKGCCFLPLKTRKALENQGHQRNSLYNHAEGVYIINAKHCISSTRSVVYYQAAGKYTLMRDDMQRRLSAFDDIPTCVG